MKAFLSCLFALYSVASFAQSFQWTRGNGGFDEDRAYGVTTDNNGNIFVTGQLQGIVDFGTFSLQANYGDKDMFVVKYDASGNALWGFTGGGAGDDGGYAIATDASGNAYVAGSFLGSATFDTSIVTSYSGFDNDIFLLALSSAGNVLWVHTAGGDGYDAARGLAVSGNHVFICGGIVVPAYFSTTQVNGVGFQDAFIARYNTNGTFDWATAYGSLFNDFANAITADANGNTYATGYFQDTATFDAFTLANGSNEQTDMFVVKTDIAGTAIWAHKAGVTAYDETGRAVALDPNGNVFVTGEFNATVSFDGEVVTSSGGSDVYVTKYNNSGVAQYAKRYGGSGNDFGYGIAASDTSVFATGVFDGAAQFGNIVLHSVGPTDAWVARIENATGNFKSAVRAGGDDNDAGRSAFINANALVVAGDYRNVGSFGTDTLTSDGVHDYFVSSFDPALNLYPCPFTPVLSTDTLVMCPSNLDVFSTGVFETYQWLQNGLPIPGANGQNYLIHADTDSGQTFSVVVMLNGCVDTSESGYVTVLSFPPLSVSKTMAGGWIIGTQFNLCDGDSIKLEVNPPYADNIQWYKDSVAISGATAQALYVTQTGLYYVKAAPAECPGYSQALQTPVDVLFHATWEPTVTFLNDTLFASPDTLQYEWYLNDTLIPGAIGSWYIPTESGSYTAALINPPFGLCARPSTPTSVIITTTDAIALTALHVYPNPATSWVNVDAPQTLRYELWDGVGRLLQRGVLESRLDVSSLEDGFYVLRLGSSEPLSHHPFVVQR